MAKRFDVDVVFSAPGKPSRVCSVLGIDSRGNTATSCLEFGYKMPLKCKRFYIGQTGRRLNIRLRVHERSWSDKLSHLSAHCSSCGCQSLFNETAILRAHWGQKTREIAGAAHIAKMGDKCISSLYASVSNLEVDYLDVT